MGCENGGYLTPHCESCYYWRDNSWEFGCGHPQFSECPYLNPIEVEIPIIKQEFVYSGPVMIFDECVQTNWKAKTKAVSKKKARSNFAYQWKVENGFAPNTKVTLPGRIIIAE